MSAWAAAWSRQDADAYLACYASGFTPPGGRGLEDWRQIRRQRLAAPDFIEIGIQKLKVKHTGEKTARARFHQTYRSDKFHDQVAKTLYLVWEADRWQIVRETSRPLRRK